MARNEHFRFRSLEEVRARVADLGLDGSIGFADDTAPSSERLMSAPVNLGPFRLANRYATHPMEGWDGDPSTGAPTEDVLRRWERMGESGAALVWGVEAFAVDFRYRANARQLVMVRNNTAAIAAGVELIRKARARAFDGAAGPVVGAQLTCSGRYSVREEKGACPPLVHHHPELDRRLGVGESSPLMTDAEMEDVIGLYARAARVAREAGFDFIDVKACHGYWLNETLAARTRPGRYGGGLENRAKPLMMAVDAVRREAGSGFPIGVRLGAFDGVPYEEDAATRREGFKGYGRASAYSTPYLWGFGVDEAEPERPDLSEPLELAGMLGERGVRMLNVTAGIPYSNPHLSRPTESPPIDGYQPPRDPLHEVATHFDLVAGIKRAHPDMGVVGTGYSYLRQFKAHAAEFNLRTGRVDVVGVGRALLSFHDEIRQLLESGAAVPGRGRVICTGDSACTTGPRLGLKSGCVFDPHYADNNREIARRLAAAGLGRK